MYDSRVIANRLIELAGQKGESLTPMQVLKLVYIAHGWMLALYRRALIRDEVQAWQYGPVIPRLYNSIRRYRSQPVNEPIVCENEEIDPAAIDIIGQVYDQYGHYSGAALSRMTHAQGTPWDRVYVEGEFGLVIPTDLIEDHYQRLAAS